MDWHLDLPGGRERLWKYREAGSRDYPYEPIGPDRQYENDLIV